MIEFSFSVSGLLFMAALIHTVSSSYFKKEMSFRMVVPVDIPRRTTDINLFGNLITRIQARTFAHLQACINLDLSNNDIAVIESNVFEGLLRLKKLVLDFNKLTEVRRDMFEDLVSIEELHLANNEISVIESRTFSNMLHLKIFFLHNNALSSLSGNVYDPTDFPKSDCHPSELKLTLSENPMECDERLCWIKLGEKKKWIPWLMHFGHLYTLMCNNIPGIPWKDVFLDCAQLGK